MGRPIVIGTVKEEDVPELLNQLNKVGYFSMVKREEGSVSYYDGVMTRHTIPIADETDIMIV